MKVLLIQPPSHYPLMDKVFLFEPLSLEYLAAGLIQHGHDVLIHDARLDPDTFDVIADYRPDVMGITAFTSQVNIAMDIAEQTRSLYPDMFIVLGGHHATVAPEDFNSSSFDAVVLGEGVFTLIELLDARDSGIGFDNIKGLGLPAPDGMKFTELREYTDLNMLPLPARELTRKHRKDYFSEWFSPLASVRTSLGCTARCTFCSLWSITGSRYLRRDPDMVVQELMSVDEDNVFFCDDESMCDVKRMSILADRIKEAGIHKKYFLYARVDTIVRHPELFEKWAAIGLKQVFVGMEDFSDKRLAAMKKNVTTMVDPEYTLDDFRMLKEYIRKLKISYATFTVMTPLPGTELYEQVENRLLSHKPELYDMLHSLVPTTLPLNEFYQQMAKLYKEAVPFYRTLPVLLKFGLHGFFFRLKLFGKFLRRVENAHLDY